MIGNDRKNPRVFGCILGISWFWLVGATFLSQFPTFAKDILHGDETVVTLLLTVFSVGIGLGSLLCSALLKGKIKSTYVPMAGICISLFTLDLFFASGAVQASGEMLDAWRFLASPGNWCIVFDLLGAAICGGIYIVPLYAIMQHDSDAKSRARTIASNNAINALFMVASAIGTMGMLKAGFSVSQVFLALAGLNVGAVMYMRRIPATSAGIEV